MTIALHLSRVRQTAANPAPAPAPSLSSKKPLSAPVPAPVVSRDEARGLVSFDYKWRKDGFGTVMIVDWIFTNRSPYDAKDITVTCTHYAPSGTEIDSNTRTIYETVPAKGKKMVKGFNMGFIHSQAASTVCKIDDLVM